MPDEHPYLKYIELFNNFIKSRNMSSTYKPVFLLALTDLGKYGDEDLVGSHLIYRDGDKVILDLNFVCVRFAIYYWDMEVAFKMRHMPLRVDDVYKPQKDVLIVGLIRKEASDIARRKLRQATNEPNSENPLGERDGAGLKAQSVLGDLQPPTLEELASDDMEGFRHDVIRYAMCDVLDKLTNDMPYLYEHKSKEKQIVLDSEIIEFFKEFSPMINHALNFILAEHFRRTTRTGRTRS